MRVVLVGDSQAAGLARPLRALLGRDLVRVNAQSGRNTSQLVPDALDDASDYRADLVIVASGGNDHQALGNPASYGDLVERITRDLRAAAGRVVWWGPAHSTDPEVARRHAAAAEVQRVAVPAGGGTWIDSRPITARLEHTPGGVHFFNSGYDAWAREVADRLPGTGGGWLLAGAGAAIGGALLARWWRRRRRSR